MGTSSVQEDRISHRHSLFQRYFIDYAEVFSSKIIEIHAISLRSSKNLMAVVL